MTVRISAIRMPLTFDETALKAAAAKKLKIKEGQIRALRMIKKSVDARKKDQVHFTVTVDVTTALPAETLVRQANDPAVSIPKSVTYLLPKTVCKPNTPPKGASGQLGDAELAAIQSLMKEG